MSQMASGIPTKTFIVNKTYSNIKAIADDIAESCGTSRYIAVSKRDVNDFSYNGIYCIVYLSNRTLSDLATAMRYRNGWSSIWVTKSYDASAPIGDEYIVYILDSIDM